MMLKTELEDLTLKEGLKLDGLVWNFLFIQEVENPQVFPFFPVKENSSRVGFKDPITHGDLCLSHVASLDLKENWTWHQRKYLFQLLFCSFFLLLPELSHFTVCVPSPSCPLG